MSRATYGNRINNLHNNEMPFDIIQMEERMTFVILDQSTVYTLS